jgi:tricorn protease-like protein
MQPKTILLLVLLLLAGCAADPKQKHGPAAEPAAGQEPKLEDRKTTPPTPVEKVASDFIAVTPPSANGLRDVSFSPDGTTIVVSGGTVFKGDVKVHDARTGKLIRSYSGGFGCAAFSCDGKRLAAAGRDCVKVWQSNTGELWKSLPAGETMVTRVAFAPGDKYLAASDFGGNAYIWDLVTGNKVHTLETPMLRKVSNWVLDIAWSQDGKRLASAGHQAVFVWDTETGKAIHKLSNFATIVAFTADGKTLVTNSEAGTPETKLWDAESGKEVRTIEIGSISAVFHPDGKRLVIGDNDGNVGTWDLATGKALKSFRAQEKQITRLAFCPHGKTFATASFDDRRVRIWDAAKLDEATKE